MLRRALVLATLVVCGIPPAAQAQTLRSRINDLFTFGTCGQPLCLDVGGEHGMHFIPSIVSGGVTVIGVLTEAIGRSAANTPISATSSGATFAIVGGLPVRTSTSAGPIFGERAQTLGRGRFFIGTNVTDLNFTSLNGVPLNDININFIHQDVGAPGLGNPSFENDVIALQLQMNVRLTVANVFATWGVTDFLDVGVAVPFVRTTISGQSVAQILPWGPVALHYFGLNADSTPILRATASLNNASATGIGDVVGRVKINLGQSQKFGAALLGDIRFPTGDAQNLIGSGNTSVRALGIASAQFGDFAPHLDAGYQFRTGTLDNDAVIANLGFDNRMTDWATAAIDFLTEWQVGASKVLLPGPVTYQFPWPRTIPRINV
ncbi:MAG TPA: hypothetical protein VJ992_07065, partial [Gemmatimonadales bacterium]|nr:hypothetical protein [Gemmatimonadales bacterium]